MKYLFNVVLVACALAFGPFTANAKSLNDSEKEPVKAMPGKELSRPETPSTPTLPVELSKPETAIDNAISAPSKDSTGPKDVGKKDVAKYSVENINAEKAAEEKKADSKKTVRKSKKHTKRRKGSVHKKHTGIHKKEAGATQNGVNDAAAKQ
jgi:hypothetical protein